MVLGRVVASRSASLDRKDDATDRHSSSEPPNETSHSGDVVAESADTATLPVEDNDAYGSLYRDIDSVLARLETGIATENAAMDALLNRLARKAA